MKMSFDESMKNSKKKAVIVKDISSLFYIIDNNDYLIINLFLYL